MIVLFSLLLRIKKQTIAKFIEEHGNNKAKPGSIGSGVFVSWLNAEALVHRLMSLKWLYSKGSPKLTGNNRSDTQTIICD